MDCRPNREAMDRRSVPSFVSAASDMDGIQFQANSILPSSFPAFVSNVALYISCPMKRFDNRATTTIKRLLPPSLFFFFFKNKKNKERRLRHLFFFSWRQQPEIRFPFWSVFFTSKGMEFLELASAKLSPLTRGGGGAVFSPSFQRR